MYSEKCVGGLSYGPLDSCNNCLFKCLTLTIYRFLSGFTIAGQANPCFSPSHSFLNVKNKAKMVMGYGHLNKAISYNQVNKRKLRK